MSDKNNEQLIPDKQDPDAIAKKKEQEEEDKKKKRRVAITITAIIAIIIIIILLLLRSCSTDTGVGDNGRRSFGADIANVSDEAIDEMSQEEIQAMLDAAVEASKMTLTLATTEWVFPSVEDEAYVGIQNVERNYAPIVVEVYAEGYEYPIYTSAQIPVGTYLNYIKLNPQRPVEDGTYESFEIEPGDYPCTMYWYYVDEEGVPFATAACNITAHIGYEFAQ